jgi:hypothetical protein
MVILWFMTPYSPPWRTQNHWAPYWEPQLVRLTRCYGSLSLQFRFRASICLAFGDPLKRTWLAGCLRQTPTWSKLSLRGCKHLTLTSFVLGYKFWCRLRQIIKSKEWLLASLMCTICYLCVACAVMSEKSSRHLSVSYIIIWLLCSSWWPWKFFKSATEEI